MKRADGAIDAAHALKCELACEVLRSFGNLRFAATGWSMLPTLWPGDTLEVDRVSRDQVQLGDVVLVGREGRLCAHRLVSKEGSGNPCWITQGDAMLEPDQPVNENELLGRVTYVIRAGKLLTVSAKLSAVERLTAKIARRSVRATRAFVYLHRMIQTPEKPSPEKSVLSCQA
jgi:hypothetical protein